MCGWYIRDVLQKKNRASIRITLNSKYYKHEGIVLLGGSLEAHG